MRFLIATVLLTGCASHEEGLKSGGPPETPSAGEPAPAEATPEPAPPSAAAPAAPAAPEAPAAPATPEVEAEAAKTPEAAAPPQGEKTAPTPKDTPPPSEEKKAATPPPPPPPAPAKASKGDAKTGRAVWDRYCGKCHGSDGKGQTKMGELLKVKDMTDPAWQRAQTDAGLAKVTREGNRAIKMPGFGTDKIDDKGLADVVAFMRGLGR